MKQKRELKRASVKVMVGPDIENNAIWGQYVHHYALCDHP